MSEFVDSTSDERTANNIVRHEHRILSEEEKMQVKEIKDLGAEFIRLCDSIVKTRELSLAKTKMEEAVFWAVKSVTGGG